MRAAIGADHAGYDLKEELKAFIEKLGYEVDDYGAHSYDALDDYPDFAPSAPSAGGDDDLPF